MPEGSLWCPTDADADRKFKSIGECKLIDSCPPSELFSNKSFQQIITVYFVFAVYRPSENTSCNVHGTKHLAEDGQCLCKEGYRGKLCNYCDFFDNYYVFDGLEGQIDLVSGNGAKCSCKYVLNDIVTSIRICTFIIRGQA